MDPTKAMTQALWEEMDTDKSGEVDFEEFCAFMKDRHQVKSRSEAEKELREVFAVLDQNGDGVVTLEEMRRFMCGMGDEPLTDEDFRWVEETFRSADTDNSGALTVDEYVASFLARDPIHGEQEDVKGDDVLAPVDT